LIWVIRFGAITVVAKPMSATAVIRPWINLSQI
jgi:hypothetical protein